MKQLLGLVVALLVASAQVEATALWRTGFELQGGHGIEWYTSDTAPTAGTFNTSTPISNTASMCVTNPSSGARTGLSALMFSSGTIDVDYFTRVNVRVDTAPNVDTTIIGWGDGVSANKVRVILKTNRTLELVIDVSESVGTSATALTIGTTARIELSFRRTAAADLADLRIDGVSVVSTSSADLSQSPTRFHIGMNMGPSAESATTASVCFDDVAVNDSQGTNNNTWPGAGKIATLFPNGAGEFTQNVTLSGSSAAATAWQSVDDGSATGTVDDVDFVTMDTSCSAWNCATQDRFAVAVGNLPETATAVNVVQLGVRVSQPAASALNSQYSIGAQTADGGAKLTMTPTSWTSTAWVLNTAATTRTTAITIQAVDPGSVAWTETTVNSLQMLFRADDASPTVQVTSMWATVEYTPDEGGGPPPSGPCTMMLLGVGRCGSEDVFVDGLRVLGAQGLQFLDGLVQVITQREFPFALGPVAVPDQSGDQNVELVVAVGRRVSVHATTSPIESRSRPVHWAGSHALSLGYRRGSASSIHVTGERLGVRSKSAYGFGSLPQPYPGASPSAGMAH